MEFLKSLGHFYFIWPFVAALRAAAATFLRRVASLHLLFHVSNVFLFVHKLWNLENQNSGREKAKFTFLQPLEFAAANWMFAPANAFTPANGLVRARGFMCA